MSDAIDANDFAFPILQPGATDLYQFGVKASDELAAHLRRLADAVEKGTVCVLRVQSGAIADRDDYAMSGLFIAYAQMVPVS